MPAYEEVRLVQKRENGTAVTASTLPSDERRRNKLIKELDPERNELFFARRVLFVEGDTEKLAIPEYARAAGIDLDRLGVTIVEVGGKQGLPEFVSIALSFGLEVGLIYDSDSESFKDQRSSEEKFDDELNGSPTREPSSGAARVTTRRSFASRSGKGLSAGLQRTREREKAYPRPTDCPDSEFTLSQNRLRGCRMACRASQGGWSRGVAVTAARLGKLERVDVRKVWLGEASDFTPWLALPDNITLLGEAIGLELEVQAQETSVGRFRADILCKDTTTGHFVLIENQLERTDHIHLGQLMTYAAGLDAVTVIWVSPRFTDEHRAALDWLNRMTTEGLNLFGLEIEVWRIGDSPMAPKFNVVSQPNDWAKTVKEQAESATGRSLALPAASP